MKEEHALKFRYLTDILSEIAYLSPSPESLRYDDYRGNEFEVEYKKLREKAKTALEELNKSWCFSKRD